MKSLEELANWGTSDLPTLLTQVILAEVEEAARARRFGRNLVRINEDLVRSKGRTMIFYRRGVLSADSISEGAVTQGQTISYTPFTLSVSKYSVAAKITQEAIDGSNLDLIRDTIREAGIALADKEDQVIVATLLGEESTLTVDAVAAADADTLHIMGHAGVTSISSISSESGNTFTVDYFNGRITGFNTLDPFTISYYWTSRDNYVDAGTEGTFSYQDIVRVANEIRGRKWSPDFMLIHPDQMADLLKNAQFVDFSKYGAREPLLRGEIGQISGMRVLVTTNMRSGNALVISSKRAAWLAIKRHIDLKRWDNPQSDSIELYFYMEYGSQVTDEDAIALLVGLGPVTIVGTVV